MKRDNTSRKRNTPGRVYDDQPTNENYESRKTVKLGVPAAAVYAWYINIYTAVYAFL